MLCREQTQGTEQAREKQAHRLGVSLRGYQERVSCSRWVNTIQELLPDDGQSNGRAGPKAVRTADAGEAKRCGAADEMSEYERARPRGRCFRCAEEDDGERAERRAEHCDGARQMRERATRENRQG